MESGCCAAGRAKCSGRPAAAALVRFGRSPPCGADTQARTSSSARGLRASRIAGTPRGTRMGRKKISDDYCCNGHRRRLTPRGKLRARPCSGRVASRYERHPASTKQPHQPDSFTGYVRPPSATYRRLAITRYSTSMTPLFVYKEALCCLDAKRVLLRDPRLQPDTELDDPLKFFGREGAAQPVARAMRW